MTDSKYRELAAKSIEKGTIDPDDIRWIMSPEAEMLPLLDAAYVVRKKYCGKKVKIHIINNVQSGNCTEVCKYCAQSRNMHDAGNIHQMKTDEEIFEEAQNAFNNGAYRYCMVYSGRDIGKSRVDRISAIVGKIKQKFRIEVCVSAGFLTRDEASMLKNAGVNRYNHNINTSMKHYGSICTSHDFKKRLDTIGNAREAGLDICCGIIIGLGETVEDLISVVNELRKARVNSIPINFFIPVEGHKIAAPQKLTPEYCLKILCLFRLAIPKTEIRAAGGREYHLRSMQALCLYAVDSVFTKGYLTVGGECIDETKQMILDNGFEIDRIEY